MDSQHPQREPGVPGEVDERSAAPGAVEIGSGVRGPVPGPLLSLPGVTKDGIIAPTQVEAARDDAVVRDSWLSFASTATSRDSVAPSIFSIRASTASASTRYSLRQSSIESPISATSPLYEEHHKDGLSCGCRYYCTFCDESFDSKTEWIRHELEVHDRRERYLCAICSATFVQASLLAGHCEREHDLKPMADMTEAAQYSSRRSAWGCGFCAAFIPSRDSYLEHVGRHYDEGKQKGEWQHTRVIEGLLHQPIVEAAWSALITREEHVRGTKLRFVWDPSTTGRSPDTEGRHSLQDMLEFFATETTKPQEAAERAYKSAQVRLERNVSHLVNQVYLRASENNTTRSALTLVEPTLHSRPASPGAADEVVSPLSPLPPPLQPVIVPPESSNRPPSTSTATFQALATTRAPPDSARLPKGTAALLRNVPRLTAQVVPVSLKPTETAGPANSLKLAKQIPLRRIDSARNLGVSDSILPRKRLDAQNEMVGSQRSLSLRSSDDPPISFQDSVDAPLTGTPLGSSPTSNNANLLPITKTTTPSSVRTYTSSSTLSTHTREGSQGFDESMGDPVSDDSLSEPDCWLEFDGKSAASRHWKRSFQQAINRGMVQLWIRYNNDWDALVKQCVGERSRDTSQFREASGLSHKGASSRQTSGKGLRPPIRPFRDDDEEDDGDCGGYGPPSSQSKQSPGPNKSFACPFRKHDPNTYNVHDHEVCAIRSWPTISRLKYVLNPR